jgi:hypothetical protein
MMIFARGMAADVRVLESTTTLCFMCFAKAIVENFEKEYMHHPTSVDVVKHINEMCGFPCMFGSKGCMQ